MGGTISVDSRENEYTKFIVTLPAKRGLKISPELHAILKPSSSDAKDPDVKPIQSQQNSQDNNSEAEYNVSDIQELPNI